ncbi:MULTISPECIES: zinc ABC transporter substrate-binding protein [unclassified Ruegeria]|uniref:zinc ABC transporter substrate-binding protein n=1 Tax=unclassified Ruegeria TaxID=2625375 RepID=UPI001AD97F26|nr:MULTISPECIES: zinc ABC transporter substrate-binding protein [unclassified Ruegeria]MBO9410134.1 zinc ABC transporter substrate-binding protein [Ruegeria sp. R8_1]MBO9414647.1 zinc ABC transporter substrate-binding protein [Ruegeria sp. R8_2]
MLRSTVCVLGAVMASQVVADPPKVVADIAPVHSLVARVMDGVAEPVLIVPPGASPHSHAMRPSEARALQSADIVFWVGEELTPWMDKPLSTLSAGSQKISLLDVDGTILHEYRDVVGESGHDDHADHDDRAGHADHDDHDHEDHADHDDHAGHKDHDDHGHEDHADHDDHAGHKDHDDHGHEDHADHDDHAGHKDHDDHGHDDHAHDHDGVDPHAWLDPENARTWAFAIANILAEVDAENAQAYQDNAKAFDNELILLSDQINADLADMKAHRFITFHDAYQYFEKRFGLETSGSVSLGDAANPGPARLATLREKVSADQIDCAFAEPQFDTRLVETAIEGSGATILDLDPVGIAVDPGPKLYPTLLQAMAQSFLVCANGS